MLSRIHIFFALLIVVPTFIISLFVAIIPGYIMKLFKAEKYYEKWMRFNGTNIARIILWSLRVKVVVEGREKIPPEGSSVCFVANHQSMLDIPTVLAALKIWAGFITKTELKKVPILNAWIASMHSVYIDRKSNRSSLQAILKGVENIKNGIPMFIFPEGTRSKTGELGKFKNGSLKLATKAKAIIVPITLDGTRLAFEQKKSIRKIVVHVTVGEPIPTADLNEEQQKELADVVFGLIQKQFRNLK